MTFNEVFRQDDEGFAAVLDRIDDVPGDVLSSGPVTVMGTEIIVWWFFSPIPR